MSEQPEGVILIRHEGLSAIAISEVLEAIPASLQQCDRKEVRVDQADEIQRAREQHEWSAANDQLTQFYEQELEPLLKAYPAYPLTYFGAVTIPLAMRLGYLVGSWHKIQPFLRHHQRKDWTWEIDPPLPKVESSGLPDVGSQAEGDAVIRVSTSYKVSPKATSAIISRPLVEIDITIASLGVDAVHSQNAIELVAGAFRDALDGIQEKFPNCNGVHVFASVPVGLAFRMGTTTTDTYHPPVHSYEYDQNTGYHHAIGLRDEPFVGLELTDDERRLTSEERELWAEEAERLVEFGKQLGEHKNPSWLDDVLVDDEAAQFGVVWNDYPRFPDLPIASSRVDVDHVEVAEGFVFDDPSRSWRLDDAFLIAVRRRISDESDRRTAARLFMLHEGLHHHQRLGPATANEVGRFAKVLEETDYHADVWALLHELARSAPEDPIAELRRLLGVAMETMFAFDDLEGQTRRMQTRRVARYLIWAWQTLMIDVANTRFEGVTQLAHKPIIELAGPETFALRQRVFLKLEPPKSGVLEVALLRKGILSRLAAGPALDLEGVLGALRTHDREGLCEALRGLLERAGAPTNS